jgi:putative colanic acid biosynthesis acetyltransferase WcaF
MKEAAHSSATLETSAEPAPPRPIQTNPDPSVWTFRQKLLRALWMIFGRALFRCTFHNWYALRALILRAFGARIGQRVHIRPTCRIEIPWHLDIGDDALIGDYSILYGLGRITIGPRTIISQYAHICAGTHDHTDPRLPLTRDPIVIGADVWIGADAFVGPNVRVGDLSVLGARSSAYKDMEPGMVYIGNPARPRGKRVLR